MELTPKQEKFCQEYVKYGNKTVAYKNSYDTETMNVATVNNSAYKLFNKPEIKARIEQIQSELAKRNKMTLDKVVKAISDIATFDIADLYDDKGKLLPLNEIPKSARSAITKLKTFELKMDGEVIGENKEVFLANKLDAFEKLMKYFGGYEKDNEQKAQPLTEIKINTVDKK